MDTRYTVCVIDVPNITAQLFEKGYITQPDWSRLYDWLEKRSIESGSVLIARAFLNYPLRHEKRQREVRHAQIHALQAAGFEVFLKPKTVALDDIDREMVHMLDTLQKQEHIEEVIIVSHDMMRFSLMVYILGVKGIPCTIVGFPRKVGYIRPIGGSSRYVQHEIFSIDNIPGLLRLAQQPA